MSIAKWRSRTRMGRALLAVAVAAALNGCSSASDLDVFGLFHDDVASPDNQGGSAVRAAGDSASAKAADQSTPALSSVPPRPEGVTPPDVRQRVVEGLVADRANARYSDQEVRLQGETNTPAATTAEKAPPQQVAAVPSGSAATPPPASPTPSAPAAATPSTAPATPPAPLPITGGPSPSVQVDPTAISGGGGYSAPGGPLLTDQQVATIYFANSSSHLDERDKQVLAQVASAQRANGAQVIVVGHASERTQQLGKVQHELVNFRISLDRANKVAEQLIAMGVGTDKVKIEAMSDAKPVYSEEMPTGEAGNRRAEIYFRQ